MSHLVLESSNLLPRLAVDHGPPPQTRTVVRSEPVNGDFMFGSEAKSPPSSASGDPDAKGLFAHYDILCRNNVDRSGEFHKLETLS